MLIALIIILVLIAAAFGLDIILFLPEKVGKTRDTVHFSNLSGKFYNESGTRGTVILAHGMGCGIDFYTPEIERLSSPGYRIFAFEYSGYPGSKGLFMGFAQAVLDTKKAIDFAFNPQMPLYLFGHSMGAYAVFAVPKISDKKIDGIIGYAPFYSPSAALSSLTGKNKALFYIVSAVQKIVFGKNSDLKADNNGIPALIIQGSNDREVTEKCSLFAHRAELNNVRAVLAENCGHMDVIRSANGVNEDTFVLTEEFLEKLN